jgi:sigma-B regulation protein RsbU (phosphoserine phosphatase)
MSLARLRHRLGRGDEAFAMLTGAFSVFTEGFATPDLADAATMLKDLGNERMRADLEAGVKYVLGCIPSPLRGPVSVDWRYIPSSTLGGDTLGFHWIDEDHLALYLIDVTGHGLDSAMLSVTVHNVIRAGSLPDADMKLPDQVLAKLNETFRGSQHGNKFFTTWYGVYQVSTRQLSYASGGHPSAVVIAPGTAQPLLLPATGTVMGAVHGLQFPVSSHTIVPGARLLIFSDGIFEIRREKHTMWNLQGCIACVGELGRHGGNIMDGLLDRARILHGSPQLDDDFSIIEARFA